MRTPEHTGVRFLYFVPGIIWFFLILFLICLPQSKVPEIELWWIEIIKPDKFIHAIMFGIQAFLFILPYKKGDTEPKVFRRKIVFIGIVVAFWGLATEYIQLQVPGRSFEWMDWLADSVGVLLVLIYFLRNKKIQPSNH
jgi:VanZ family protein